MNKLILPVLLVVAMITLSIAVSAGPLKLTKMEVYAKNNTNTNGIYDGLSYTLRGNFGKDFGFGLTDITPNSGYVELNKYQPLFKGNQGAAIYVGTTGNTYSQGARFQTKTIKDFTVGVVENFTFNPSAENKWTNTSIVDGEYSIDNTWGIKGAVVVPHVENVKPIYKLGFTYKFK